MIQCNTFDSMVNNLTPIQRMVVTHDGTLQELLSAYFGKEIGVSVHHQSDDYGVIIRNSVLHTCDDAGDSTDVCLATSVIRTVTSTSSTRGMEFLSQIRQCKYGIGFILNKLGIKTRREIMDIHANEEIFRRVYRIYDDESEINVIIIETFPAYMYKTPSTNSYRVISCHL